MVWPAYDCRFGVGDSERRASLSDVPQKARRPSTPLPNEEGPKPVALWTQTPLAVVLGSDFVYCKSAEAKAGN